MAPKLTIGMAVYDDFDGAYFTIQAIRHFYPTAGYEIVIIDNYGDDQLKRWIETWGKGQVRYVRYTDITGTSQSRNMVFQEALGEWVLCIDSHVIAHLHPLLQRLHGLDPKNLYHGPMCYDNITAMVTHMKPVWRDNMFGIWADVVGEKDLPGEPFEIPMHGLGLFLAHRESWLGFNPAFRGFGGEEGYIHEKYRQAGGKVMCLPWLRWVHRFSDLHKPTYPIDLNDRIRNYLIGWKELGLSTQPIEEHFGLAPEKSAIDTRRPVLLIANGPAALSKELGKEIDAFPGDIVRFNNFETRGYEKYVGSRTDIWFTCCDYGKTALAKENILCTWNQGSKTDAEANRLAGKRLSRDYLTTVVKELGIPHPSSGIFAVETFLAQGREVYLWGFNFLEKGHGHHYNNDKLPRGDWHDSYQEFLYFHKRVEEEKVKWFGRSKGESFPVFRQPMKCGKDDNLAFYREPAHNAWYEFFGSRCPGYDSILDVGAGMGEGLKILKGYCLKAVGVEMDERLLQINPKYIIDPALSSIPDKSYDAVTCVDVIEHVVNDLELFENMKRIARKKVLITTPCYARSRCGNPAHCREYTIPQFVNIFKPSRVWSASPDGKVHRTLLLEGHHTERGYVIIDYTDEGPMNKKAAELKVHRDKLPLDMKFNKTVDNQEWAHIAAEFLIE